MINVVEVSLLILNLYILIKCKKLYIYYFTTHMLILLYQSAMATENLLYIKFCEKCLCAYASHSLTNKNANFLNNPSVTDIHLQDAFFLSCYP